MASTPTKLFFAIVDDGVLYLKADALTAPHFEERGLSSFEYVKDGRVMKMAYFTAPEEVLRRSGRGAALGAHGAGRGAAGGTQGAARSYASGRSARAAALRPRRRGTLALRRTLALMPTLPAAALRPGGRTTTLGRGAHSTAAAIAAGPRDGAE